jgi:hypothetical protein
VSASRLAKIRGGWSCGFYPGCAPGGHADGSAVDFEAARDDFEVAWRQLLSRRTEADFQAWRDARDWTARKYAMWERGERMPSQQPGWRMRCPCGETFEPDEVPQPHFNAVPPCLA